MEHEYIIIKNAREHNLQNVSCTIPKGNITVFTGVSGSGKSSLVFDTIAQEAGRQLNETYSAFTRQFLPKYKRPDVDAIENLATAIVIDQKRLGGNSRSTLGTITDINPMLRLLFSRFAKPSLGNSNVFSFNDPQGMCPECEGIGHVLALNVEAAIDDEKSLQEGAILLPGCAVGTYTWKIYAESGNFDIHKKIKDYSKEELHQLLYGDAQTISVSHGNVDINATFEGLVTRYMRLYVKNEKEETKQSKKFMDEFVIHTTCPTCTGMRYNHRILEANIQGYSIYDLTAMQLDTLCEVLSSIHIENADGLLEELQNRIQKLCDIGIGYLTLTRETSTLSGGESQRVKMVKHLSSNLTGMLYILDEPSTGLHPSDVHRLNDLLIGLKEKGNTILVVEHDPDVIKIADHIIDMGPHAGTNGGHIMFTGSFKEVLQSNTLTGQFLEHNVSILEQPRAIGEFYESDTSSLHNLKNVKLRIPKGVFTVITGVAGSGKSTLVNEVFMKKYPDTIRIDQKPIHTSSRSSIATYIGVMDAIRKAFSTKHGLASGLFSHNSQGACNTCKGSGKLTLHLSFMETSEMLCNDCNGSRYKEEVLQYTYKEKNIVDIMEMTIAEAITFFEEKDIQKKLTTLLQVGLEYVTLGQPLSTLSGGECQRLKLANELRSKGTIYILDEPTTGLHLSDIENIIDIIQHFVNKGNTVIVIEHNTDVIRQADWIIDLGPGGGSEGGYILYEGVVRDLVHEEKSITAKYV